MSFLRRKLFSRAVRFRQKARRSHVTRHRSGCHVRQFFGSLSLCDVRDRRGETREGENSFFDDDDDVDDGDDDGDGNDDDDEDEEDDDYDESEETLIQL